jgi:hypothetical protein
MKLRRTLLVAVSTLLSVATFAQQAAHAKIKSGSKIFVDKMGGLESYVIAGIVKKNVAVSLVSDPTKADYIITGDSESHQAGWAKMLLAGSQASAEQASVNLRDAKSGDILWAYSVNKINSYKGKQSAGEACAKHLKEVVGAD